VGATETGILENEHHCIINTVLSLMASTTVTFYLSQKLSHGKFDPVDIANSTLAGGVAIGSVGRLNIGPGAAIITGSLAGAASVCGYVYSSPFLESTFGIFDTCGVGNLHGYPSVVGALLSIGFIAFDAEADFLQHSMAGLSNDASVDRHLGDSDCQHCFWLWKRIIGQVAQVGFDPVVP
jgi:ammonium transporter Rh